jgi:NADPH:quinone reductase-like Zn-dependent oxidoreductase
MRNVGIVATVIAAVWIGVLMRYSNLLQSVVAANGQHGNVGSGKRALIIGATSGIGRGLAIRLAKADFAVSVVGRSKERGLAVVEELKSAGGEWTRVYFV